jgi:hypothetical protein
MENVLSQISTMALSFTAKENPFRRYTTFLKGRSKSTKNDLNSSSNSTQSKEEKCSDCTASNMENKLEN